MAESIDQQIMNDLFKFIKNETGISVKKSAPKKSDVVFPYIIGHRVNTISINAFMRSLQLGFDSCSDDYYLAHENAAQVLDAINKWFDSAPFNLLGNAPEVNGMNDDGEHGVYVTELTVQIGYQVMG